MNGILIIGKPNSGKSLLFNRLTGLSQRVANFPGITVEVRNGVRDQILFSDFPGVYSLQPLSQDEQISVLKFKEALQDPKYKTVLCILDATRLERSLVLGLQAFAEVTKANKPILFALNMMDEIVGIKGQIQVDALQKEIGAPVVPISARTQMGLDELRAKLKILASDSMKEPMPIAKTLDPAQILSEARRLNRAYGPKTDVIIKSQNQIDNVLLSGTFGGIIFCFIMLLLFQSIFTWSTPFMDSVEWVLATSGTFVSSLFGEGIARDFINDALFGGLGSFLVFVPQIFVLTFIIGILEDSGYMARAAVICHKPLSLFGLTGKSFVPILSGHACAIPAILAARSIESPKKRILTMLAIPLTVCSARLPVYSLLITTLIPAHAILGGLIGLQGLVFFALYLFGILMTLIVSALLAKTWYKNKEDAPFVVEMPPYRWPHWRPLITRSMQSAVHFITKAGGVIFSVTVVVWILGYFPNGGTHLHDSWLGQLGHFIEPIFKPLGLDWKYGVAVLASFLAREVFVGTLGTMYGIEDSGEDIQGLSTHLQNAGLSLASGLALVALYAVALQCASTVAVLKKELGNWRAPIAIFVGYGVLSYALAFIVYRIVLLFG